MSEEERMRISKDLTPGWEGEVPILGDNNICLREDSALAPTKIPSA